MRYSEGLVVAAFLHVISVSAIWTHHTPLQSTCQSPPQRMDPTLSSASSMAPEAMSSLFARFIMCL